MQRSKPFQVGITGGIGSGKSLICRMFSLLGAPVYNADERSKWLTNNHPEIISSIKDHFGSEAYQNRELNRSYIASRVFTNPEELKALNSIIHPKVAEDYSQWVCEQEFAYVIKEAAIMFESNSHKQLDYVINVAASDDIRIKRVLMRDSFRSEEEIKNIIAKQMSEEERANLADTSIINDGSVLVIPQVLSLHNKWYKKR